MKLLVVDGNSILNRAFYGIKPLTTKDGQFTNAIYGFLTMLLKMTEDISPEYVAIAFDLKTKTFRHKAYDLYKANRKGMPNELASQLPILKEILTCLGYKIVTCENYEADDILGTLSHSCSVNKNECILATGDRDNLQLIDEYVKVRLSKNLNQTEIYDIEKVKEEYSVTPRELIEIKAIQGDSSDNIPGVPGIGKKGAEDLISKYHSIDYIYEHIDEIDIKEGQRQKLKDGKESCYMSRMLGEINLEAPIDTNIESYSISNGDKEKASRLMAKLELFKLIDRFSLNLNETNEKSIEKNETVNLTVEKSDVEKINEIVENSDLLFIHPVIEDNKLISFYLVDDKKLLFFEDEKLLKTLLENEKEKVVYDSKPLFSYADRENIEIKNLAFDITLAAYLLNPSSSSYELNRLISEYGICLLNSDDENLSLIYSIKDLYYELNEEIKAREQEKLLKEIEIPLSNVLARMENIGFLIDVEGIKNYGIKLDEKIVSLQSEIYELVGYEFNINSPKQLGIALFEKLNLPAKKKTKTGYSTSADVLEELRSSHPVIDKILEYRTISKLKSTYCDSLITKVDSDGRIHSSFNQKETRTGRISSTEPNLQNIPVRTELGRELRKFFIPKEGSVLVDADYSQIELRVLSHISDDDEMKKAFLHNVDIHTLTASEVFNLPLDMVTSLMRTRAKAVNFGIVYGMGAFSLSKDIEVSVREAKEYIENYLNHFSKVDSYMKETIEKAKELGYVETIFGRRRYLPELTASNHMTRAFGERVARNAPIQGTAADIIKIAMIKVDERLKKENLHSRLILQVHDELIVEAPVDESMRVMILLQEEMENAVKLSVPLVAEAKIGETWFDAKG